MSVLMSARVCGFIALVTGVALGAATATAQSLNDEVRRVMVPLKLARVLPAASCAAICIAGEMAAPAAVVVGCTVTVSRAGAIATRKSAADSALPPNEVQALERPVWSTVRVCQ